MHVRWAALVTAVPAGGSPTIAAEGWRVPDEGAVGRLDPWRNILVMTRFGSIAMVVGSAAVITLSACGETAATAQDQGFQHWYPSTPIPTPGLSKTTPTPLASATPAASAGQAQASGLGTPAEKVSATAALKFDPSATTAKVGDVIQWTNTGNVAHNVTFTDPSLTSGTLNQGDTWQVKFTVAGTYSYHCTFHPGMDGQLTVGH
ncbi:MAG TPA: plastocyanin/azurin family copper-binding protein [Candidatus Dormibacteraeota bacterium]|nr:plastocyanin/azurin family copper-binding protein [Candidatus Dormibacteraeota bacterium]